MPRNTWESQTRFVDTAGKSRFVAKEFLSRTTDEYNAQETTMATNRVIDMVVTRRRHARMIMDVHRDFRHLEEDWLVLVDPP